jgi:monoamine oxidase
MGCAWLHSADRNPWTELARRYGLAVDRHLPDWGWRFARRHQLAPEAVRDREAAFARFWEVIDGFAGNEDRALSDLLPADDPWLPGYAAVTTYVSGAEADRLSLVDLARYEDTQVNWRVVAGYGHLVERHAAGLDIVAGTPVTAIDWAGPAVRVDTARGPLDCRAVVLTVPTPLLASDQLLRFTPALPAAKVEAALGLPMGHVVKLLFRLDGPPPWPVEPDRQVIGDPNRERTAIYHLQPLGRPLVEAYWGGRLALDLERAGTPALAAFALDELAALFGPAVRDRLVPARASAWTTEPWSQGAYTYALPGTADARQVLAEPLDGRLFFAGEACSRGAFSTAHGAFQTGVAAAAAVATALGLP